MKWFVWLLTALLPLISIHAQDDADDADIGSGDAAKNGPIEDWAVPVAGWKPVQAGEHPRLIFRKSDVPELRKRAQTPEGKVMIARCEEMLNKRFTTWNGAGFAFLYQVTGDQKYADQARVAIEQTLGRAKNHDGRYTYPGNGQLRAGPVLSAVGLAYDMAYDGWDKEYREKVAQAIMDNPMTAEIANTPRHVPGCNHWGAHTGGLGVALIGINGDPGIDQKTLDDYLGKVVVNARREIAFGYGDRGFYFEGHYCGRISSNTGLIPFIQAYRVAAGRDLVAKSSNAQWLSAKWIYEMTRYDGKVRSLQRGMYGRDPFTRGEMLSSDGDFSQGFGICPDEMKPYLLWTYNHIVQPGADKDYDIVEYPHLAAYALANWPIGMAEKSPEGALPNILHDTEANYFVFRNGWKGDESDIVVTALLGSKPGAGRGMSKGGSIWVLGRGMRYEGPGMFYTSELTHFDGRKDGSGVIAGKRIADLSSLNDKKKGMAMALPLDPNSLAVDFSGKSGAELLVVQVGPYVGKKVEYWQNVSAAKVVDQKHGSGYFTKTTMIKVVDQPGFVMTLQKGQAPAPKVEGNAIIVGGQRITWDGRKLGIP